MTMIKTGSIMFVLWGLLHIWVGVMGAAGFFADRPLGIFGALGATGESVATPVLEFAAHVALEFSMLLAVLGIQAIWMAALIWQGRKHGFWLNAVILGLVDAAFVYALVWPGYTPLAEGLPGPILYVLGVVFTALGFARAKPALSDRSALRTSAG